MKLNNKKNDMVLVFENCEIATIKEEYISSVSISGVTEQVFYNTFGKSPLVTKKAAKAILSFVNLPEEDAERINKYRDITQVVFGGTVYHMDWPDDDGTQPMYDNPQQKNRSNGKYLDVYINGRFLNDS